VAHVAARFTGWAGLKKVQILLADDHPHFSDMVENLLGSTFEVVGKVGDGRALLEAAMKLKPDIIVTDISMPVLNGIDAADELQRAGCTSKIIFLTVHSDTDFVRTCIATGAFGYIVKPRVALDLVRAINEVLAGHLFISPSDEEQTLPEVT
jgi:DNA-binding NarL/FixJ family response regulator